MFRRAKLSDLVFHSVSPSIQSYIHPADPSVHAHVHKFVVFRLEKPTFMHRLNPANEWIYRGPLKDVICAHPSLCNVAKPVFETVKFIISVEIHWECIADVSDNALFSCCSCGCSAYLNISDL